MSDPPVVSAPVHGAPERILVAMSGGVDSAVTAALLREAGHEVIGVTLRLRPCGTAEDTGSCCGLGEIDSARAAADALGIAHYVWDVADRFEAAVLRPAWRDYDGGRTPNPCIQCNEAVKLATLCGRAPTLGATAVATGHYARVGQDAAGRPTLHRGRDRAKDQSYFLYRVAPAHLAVLRLPLGELTKAEVRAHAARLGLPCASRPESQDACLAAADGSFAEALRLRFGAPARPGPILDPEGRELGRHDGIHRFTLGQRKGTGLALGQRAYVAAIDGARAAVTLATDPASLEAAGLVAAELHWLDPTGEDAAALLAGRSVEVQVRYRSPAVPATLEDLSGRTLRIRFAAPQRAVSPGQAAVLYDGDRVLGGGPVEQTFAS